MKAEADAYRFYVTDTLYFLSHSEAPAVRFREWLQQQSREEEEEADADEIISGLREKLERMVDK